MKDRLLEACIIILVIIVSYFLITGLAYTYFFWISPVVCSYENITQLEQKVKALNQQIEELIYVEYELFCTIQFRNDMKKHPLYVEKQAIEKGKVKQ